MMKSFLSVILILMATSVHAQIYKWIDENGAVHYGDKPVAGSEAVDVDQQKKIAKPLNISDEGEEELTREEKRQRVSDMLEEDRLDKAEKKEKERQERVRKKEKCNSLKDYQRRASDAGRMYQLDKEGNRVYMSNEQKGKSEQKLQKRIQKDCG